MAAEIPVLDIPPSSDWRLLDLRELAYREPIYFLSWRDIKVRVHGVIADWVKDAARVSKEATSLVQTSWLQRATVH